VVSKKILALGVVLGAVAGVVGTLAVGTWTDSDVDRDARPNTTPSTGLMARLPRPGDAVVLRSAPDEDPTWVLRAAMGEPHSQATGPRGQFCLKLEINSTEWAGGGQCADPRRMERLTFGMQGPGSGLNATYLYGVTSAKAARIVLKLADHEPLVLQPQTSTTFPGLHFFATVLPAPTPGSVQEVVALDGAGAVLMRRSTRA
jgi:hypothetical protein